MGAVHGRGGPTHRSLTWHAAGTSIGLSLLFVVVYGGTNWLTAHRPAAQVDTWCFSWEATAIPFVSAGIVPYMSIDLLFFLAPFLCRTDRERRVLARRVVFSILMAAVFFLLVPLKLTWQPRPATDGWFGVLVERSCSAPFLMEYPHNLFPALHVTLAILLADVYGRATGRLLRVGCYVWFSLIILSTVLTWQHHVIDVLGGAMLAGFACFLFRDSVPATPRAVNRRIGGYYVAGAIGVLATVPAVWPWGVFLLAPAGGLALVAAGYFGLGPGIYRKVNGRLPWSTRFVLGPILLGQYLSLVYYRRRSRAWDLVTPSVLIGRQLAYWEAAAAVDRGVTAVLDLTAEFSAPAPFRTLHYRSLPVLDLTAPTPDQVHEAVAFITAEAARGVVYVHCKVGYSRSAAVVGAYLLATGRARSAGEAAQQLQSARPGVVIRPEARQALRAYAATLPGRAPVVLPRASPLGVGS